MSAALAVFHLAFRGTVRSHPLRAAWALTAVAAALSPALVAFAFTGTEGLATEGALGTACLFAPAAALFAGVGFATGDAGGEGLAPILRSALSPARALIAAAAGIGAATGIAALAASVAGAAALRLNQGSAHLDAFPAPLAASLALAMAGAATGLLLGILSPRALAGTLAALLIAGVLALPAAAGSAGLPRPDCFLLARDAAFGALPPRAALLSCAASLAFAAAAVAAGVAVLRVKDLAPRPGPT